MASGSAAETIVGGVVLAVAVGFVAFAVQSTGGGIGSGSYPLHASFRSVDGIAVGSEVRMAGIRVGSVTALELDTETFQARATFTIRDGVMVPDDSDVRVSTEGLLGGAYLEITPGASDFMLAAGDEILNTQGSVSLLNLLLRFVAEQ